MRIVMKPLNENYKTVAIRTTHMESFAMCPYKYKFEPQKFDNEEALQFGTLVWAILWAFRMWWDEKWYALSDIIARKYPEISQYANFYNGIPAYREYMKDKKAICSELKMTYEIEMWDYLLILSWTIDSLLVNKNGKYIIADDKTSKQEWTQETMNTKIQKYLYPFLLAQYVWRENIDSFDYLVFTKHSLPKKLKSWKESKLQWPRFWLRSYKPEQKYIEDYMFNLFDYFCRSMDDNLYITKQDIWCYYCKLRNTSCPIYNKSTPVDNDIQTLPF